MKVFGIFGGLGSQMCKYAVLKKVEKQIGSEGLFIDTSMFDIVPSWNGYELDKIFGIEHLNIRSVLGECNYQIANNDKLSKADFTKDGIPIPVLDYMVSNCGKPIKIYQSGKSIPYYGYSQSLEDSENKYALLNKIKWAYRVYSQSLLHRQNSYKPDYLSPESNIYFGEFNHTSNAYFPSKEEMRKVFKFKEFDDDLNKKMSQKMFNEESVAMSIRRSDHMHDNAVLFRNGYFAKSVKLVKRNSKNPVFYIFSEDIKWCKDNLMSLGLEQNDKCIFVDWNRENDSYKDMQLMTYCKHNILVSSTFCYWGYYLSNRNDKIVCAPKGVWIDVENHF